MKVTLNTKLFKDCLQDVARVIPNKSNVGIIENYLFIFTKNNIEIVGTNLDTTIARKFDIDNKENFKCLVMKKINDIVKNLNSDTIDLSFIGGKIIIDSDNTKFNLAMQSGEEDFPVLNIDLGKMQNLTLKNSLLQSVVHAVGKDELRPSMTGVFVGERNNDLIYCATDGHRLSKITDSNEDNYKGDIIIHAKFIELINKVKENLLNFKVDNKSICLIGNDSDSSYLYYNRLVNETYPDFNAVIPEKFEQSFQVNRAELLEKLKKIFIVSDESRKVIFDIKDSEMSIEVENLNIGNSASDKIGIRLKGENIRFGMNMIYLLDVLKNMYGEVVVVEYSNPIKPFVFYGGLREKEINLIMPVRINE